MPDLIFIKDDLLKNLKIMLKKELNKVFSQGDKVAVKVHMGEKGNKFFIKPEVIKVVVGVLKSLSLKPFLFDSIVAYPGGRTTVKDYLETAKQHGFTEESIGCPIIISDESINVKTTNLSVGVCKDLADADAVLVLSHVKGHICCGFGGSIKNLGMGGVNKETKIGIHEGGKPVMIGDCNGCGMCVKNCPINILKLEDGKVVLDNRSCIGCSNCIYVCENGVLKPQKATFDKLLAEGAAAALKNFKKTYFVNFIIDIATNCDCESNAGPIILEDIGILLGKDVVAIDQASLDLINEKAGKDLFSTTHKKSPNFQIEEAEKLGMGKKSYNLKKTF